MSPLLLAATKSLAHQQLVDSHRNGSHHSLRRRNESFSHGRGTIYGTIRQQIRSPTTPILAFVRPRSMNFSERLISLPSSVGH